MQIKKKKLNVKNEFIDLHELLDELKTVWENYESYLNSIQDEDLMEQWSFKVLIQKQLYRYVLRLVKDQYERGDTDAKYFYYSRGNINLNPPS